MCYRYNAQIGCRNALRRGGSKLTLQLMSSLFITLSEVGTFALPRLVHNMTTCMTNWTSNFFNYAPIIC